MFITIHLQYRTSLLTFRRFYSDGMNTNKNYSTEYKVKTPYNKSIVTYGLNCTSCDMQMNYCSETVGLLKYIYIVSSDHFNTPVHSVNIVIYRKPFKN